MSIKVKDVLERILAQVAEVPLPILALELHTADALRDPSRNAALGILRADLRSAGPLETNLHFWAFGLRAFMRARGDERDFFEQAERGLCRFIECSAVAEAVDRLLTTAKRRPAFDVPDTIFGAYEMFADENRRSVLIESRGGCTALFWENDATLPASAPLLRLLWALMEAELGPSPDEAWVIAQHDADLSDPGDVSYAWRIGRETVAPADVDALAAAPRLRIVLEHDSRRIRLSWTEARGSTALRELFVSGEGKELSLVAVDDGHGVASV